ncbi:MAG TPA: LamG-like jellyroll fold domain-containing protein, partial [Ignavibacteria bacterium]
MKRIIFLFILLVIFSGGLNSQYYYNQWVNFDGVNDYMAAANDGDLTLDSAFTIESWIFVQDTVGANKTILSKVNSSLSDGYALLVQGSASNPGNAGKLQLNLNGGNYSFVQTAATRLALNGWSHFAVTFQNAFPNNDTIRFYINGTLIQSFTSNIAPLANTADSLRIGNCYVPGNFANGLRGRLDNLRIYKSVKTASVIANNRGVPLGMEMVTNIAGLNSAVYFSNLAASWNFDGNGFDRVGSFNDLTVLNGAYLNGNGFNPDNYRTQTNYYMRFPGGSWIAASDAGIFDLDTACTIEAWVYIDAYRAAPQTIISKGSSAYNYILAISSTPSNAPIFILNSGTKILQGGRPILPRVWTHIAATYRGSTGQMELYSNGVLDSLRSSAPGNISLSNDSLFIGKSLFGETMYGNMDAVKISKYVKTQQEISNFLYTSLDNLNYTGNSGLQASYNFEGNTLDNINNSNIAYPRLNVYFERLNNVSGAGGAGEAPLLRLSNNDGGFIANSYSLNAGRIHVGNGTTVRDSILINNVSGSNRVTLAVLMNHTNATDVTLNLRAPNGTNINLISATGGTNNDIMTVFDDFADSLINTSLVPFSMRVRPVTPLSNLPQTNQNGYWRLSVTDNSAAVDSGRVYRWGIKFISTVGISIGNYIPERFSLHQNYPNPFNPVTTIKFENPSEQYIELKIFDATGQEIQTLINDNLKAGVYCIEWNGEACSSGVYFYRLVSKGYSETKKLLLIK